MLLLKSGISIRIKTRSGVSPTTMVCNNDGLMTFDGNYWKIYPLPNKAAIKSLTIDDSGNIYVGGGSKRHSYLSFA